MKHSLLALIVSCGLLFAARAGADTTVTVDPSAPWQGFMNVFELPSNGGAYVFGSSWGVPDLVATFSGPTLTLAPNTIGDPASFWYTPSGGPGAAGNKTMDANMYVEKTDTLSGQHLTFTGNVSSNTLVSPYTSVAFIKDFAPDYSSNVTVTAPLNAGVFSISLDTIGSAGRHVQYGFETIGPDVWITDVGPKGNVQVTGVPEPATAGLVSLGLLGMALARRK
jgi:hypothetical protein